MGKGSQVRVIDAKIVKVSPKLYRTLLSFVNSSLKAEYIWNTGVHLWERESPHELHEQVIFEKPHKWILRVVYYTERTPEGDRGVQYALLETPDASPCIKSDGVRVEVMDKEASFTIDCYKEPVELQRTFILPSRPLPFAGPLPLARVIDRIAVYSEAAAGHIETCEAPEAAETPAVSEVPA